MPGYQSSIGTPMNKLFERLKVDKPVWRLNWSVVDDPALFQPFRMAVNEFEIEPQSSSRCRLIKATIFSSASRNVKFAA